MFLRHNLIALTWAIIVAVLILMPGEDIPSSGNLLAVDKVAHIVVYSVLSFATIVGFIKQPSVEWIRRNAIISSFTGCLLYSSVLEIVQNSIPDRQFDLLDIVANTAGIGLGILIFYFIYRI